MIDFFVMRLLSNKKDIILYEVQFIKGFMNVLMKPVNTGKNWEKNDKKWIRRQIRYVSAYIPSMSIFLLPGGLNLLPVLVRLLERRSKRRD